MTLDHLPRWSGRWVLLTSRGAVRCQLETFLSALLIWLGHLGLQREWRVSCVAEGATHRRTVGASV